MVVVPGVPPVEVRTTDISIEGLGIVAAVNPRPGTGFTVQFMLPMQAMGAVPIEVNVKVANSVLAGSESGFKIGLKFVNPDAKTQAVLKQFLK